MGSLSRSHDGQVSWLAAITGRGSQEPRPTEPQRDLAAIERGPAPPTWNETGGQHHSGSKMTSVSPVGDAGAAALCQLEGVLQLLNGIGVPATTGPVLPSQLEERRVIVRVLAERERHLLHHK